MLRDKLCENVVRITWPWCKARNDGLWETEVLLSYPLPSGRFWDTSQHRLGDFRQTAYGSVYK